jgi:hypothetical protein
MFVAAFQTGLEVKSTGVLHPLLAAICKSGCRRDGREIGLAVGDKVWVVRESEYCREVVLVGFGAGEGQW